MTVENCQRLMQNCLDHDDEVGAEIYRERIERKTNKYPKYAHLIKTEVLPPTKNPDEPEKEKPVAKKVNKSKEKK